MKEPFNLNLDEVDLYACGRVAVWSSMLETTMEVAIWTMLNLPMTAARRMTHDMSASRKREMLAFLSQTKAGSPKEQKELRAILKDVEEVLEQRNCVIHGLWHVGPDGKPWSVKYGKGGNARFHDRLDKLAVNPVAQRAKRLAVKLARWVKRRDPSALAEAFPKITATTERINPWKWP